MKIRTKFVGLTTILLSSLIVAIFAMVARNQRRSFEEQSARRLDAIMEGVGRIAKESVANKDRLMLLSYLLHLRAEHPDLSFAEVRKGDAEPSRLGEDRDDLIRVSRQIQERGSVTYKVTADPDRSALTVSTSGVSLQADGSALVQVDAEAVPSPMVVTLGFDRAMIEAEIREALRPVRRQTAAIAAAFLALGFIGTFSLASLLTKPLVDLAAAVTLLGGGKLDVSVPAKGNDEVAALGRVFNENAARLRELMQFREDVLHTLTHELNTPLSALKGYLGLFQAEVSPTPDSLKTMEAAVLRMEQSLGGALSLFRSQAQGKGLRRLLWVDGLIVEMAGLFSPVAESKGLRVTLPPRDRVECLYADEELLRQVLTNLYSNALKYTPTGGEVRVGLEADAGAVVVTVSDTGPGIPEADLPHIFKKFYRAQGTRIPGSGLGLHIAHKAAAALGGALEVESAAGRGTIFRIRLPKLPAHQEAA